MPQQSAGQRLPKQFLIKMKSLLGEEYDSFLQSYHAERARGIRLNPLKVFHEEEKKELTARFGLRKVPWAEEGYYYDMETRPGNHSFHEAGVFYIQEPSAMAVAELLKPEPGERVLDLCAAPGGKTTQIGGKLLGRGFLLSNEIHPARAKILSQNVERMGIVNTVVTNEDPETLALRFPCFFHKIVVDAPCSGEGMFRKEEEASKQWSPENVAMCARRQAEILDQAAIMLKPGGRMIYSTCTFSPEENERNIEKFLERNRDFSIEHGARPEGLSCGRAEWSETGLKALTDTFRIWPHVAEGEGHYLAVLKKDGDAKDFSLKKSSRPAYVKDRQVKEAWRTFAEETFTREGHRAFGEDALNHMVLFGDQLYLIPKEMPDLKGLKVLRPGLHLGTLKKNRFEPSHALALCLNREQVKGVKAMEEEGPEIKAYLRGEVLRSDTGEKPYGDKGWVLMLAGSYSIGWSRQVGDTFKNCYPKGLRRRS
ncbi:MAG: RNA methyltransferase [Hungatella sp.]|nr:RNA methyltransferase [Hungatella sp.]